MRVGRSIRAGDSARAGGASARSAGGGVGVERMPRGSGRATCCPGRLPLLGAATGSTRSRRSTRAGGSMRAGRSTRGGDASGRGGDCGGDAERVTRGSGRASSGPWGLDPFCPAGHGGGVRREVPACCCAGCDDGGPVWGRRRSASAPSRLSFNGGSGRTAASGRAASRCRGVAIFGEPGGGGGDGRSTPLALRCASTAAAGAVP